MVNVALQALIAQQQAQQQQWGQALPSTSGTYAQHTIVSPFSGYCSQAMPHTGFDQASPFQQPHGAVGSSLPCLTTPFGTNQLQQQPAAAVQQHDAAPQPGPVMQAQRAGSSYALQLAFPSQGPAVGLSNSATETAFDQAGRRQPGQAALAQPASR